LFFEFPELVFAVFKGGKQKAPVEVGLASVKERGDIFCESFEDVPDHL
jgi:hypothetical protein